MSKYLYAALVLASLTATWATPAAAVEYPWCAQYGWSGQGGRNCGFSTYRQCMATVSGIGGYCERNQFYQGRRRR
ncbi:MAG TPA: DUF3551 domain-containing protein [Pseudolabrys sp.]|nr:DUF3551 domain-containing protein [Pseudolabrys sp.]